MQELVRLASSQRVQRMPETERRWHAICPSCSSQSTLACRSSLIREQQDSVPWGPVGLKHTAAELHNYFLTQRPLLMRMLLSTAVLFHMMMQLIISHDDWHASRIHASPLSPTPPPALPRQLGDSRTCSLWLCVWPVLG